MSSLSLEEINRFIPAPNGSFDFGNIEEDHALILKVDAGPIRLQAGIPSGKGFGKGHIESYPDRMTQISRLGFHSCEDFVYAVGTRYQKIGEGDGEDKLSLIYRLMGYDLRIIVKHNPFGFWSVTTGLPYRVARCKTLLEVSREDGSEPTSKPAEAPRLAILSLPKR